jgi:hypothetical protein
MKYIEELKSGECFVSENNFFLLTSDYKKNGQRLCYSLNDGYPKWFDSNFTVIAEPIYWLDKENNVIAVRPTQKENDN